jgi:hypothetical protein
MSETRLRKGAAAIENVFAVNGNTETDQTGQV